MTGIGTHSQIESLESRIAPAGLITVTFNNGALELTSDASAHAFSITALDATTVLFSSTDGSTFTLDGGPAMDSLTLLLLKPIKSLSATLGSGADQLTVTGLNVAGDIAIDLGGGDNSLTLDTITTKRGIEITGGDALDDIKFQGGLNSVKKDLVLNLGPGDNGFLPQSALLDIGGSLSYTGGAGADAINLTGNLNVKGSAQFNWGAGTNQFGSQLALISSVSVGKDLSFDSFASTSAAADITTVGLGGLSLNVKGAFRVVDGAGKLVANPAVGPGLLAKIGSASIVTGAGESTVSFTNAAFAAKSVFIDASESSTASLDPAAVASQVLLGGFTGSFSSNFTYLGGAGNDSVVMQLLSGISTKGPSSLKIDLGDGNNTVQAFSFAGFFKNVSVTGGSGTDGVLVAAVGASINSIVIDNGGGDATTQMQIADAKITGQIKVTNGTGAGTGVLGLAFLNSQIGGVSYVSDLASNQVGFGAIPGFFASNSFTVKKSLDVTTGNGNDSVDFANVTNGKVGKINLSLGDGANGVGGAFANFSAKALNITGGSGSDTVNLGGTGSLGAVNLSLGAGMNTAAFSGETVPLAMSALTYVSESAAMQTDALILARILVSGKLSATFGADASNLKIDDSIIGGPLNAETGAGVDVVSIDTVDTNAGTTFLKPVSILLGAGDDTLVLGGEGTSRQVITKSTFKADGGADTNTLVNDTDNVFAKDPVFEKLTLS